MPRTILVTEGSSPLGAALVRLLAARGYAVASTSDRPQPAEPPAEDEAPRSPLSVSWNRRSPVSARTVVLSVLNSFETLDEALILEPACAASGPLNHVASADIERAFDDIKGTVFLSRDRWRASQSAARNTRFVELGGKPEFQARFMDSMMF